MPLLLVCWTFEPSYSHRTRPPALPAPPGQVPCRSSEPHAEPGGAPGDAQGRIGIERLKNARGLDMDLLQFLAFLFVLLLSGTGATGTLRTSLDPSLEIYKKMFEVKRREQLLALKNLAQLNDIHQQYKILDVMLKGLFKVLEDSRTVLTAADVLPDGPFPQDEKLKDAFSHVVENTAFFGDVVLRFPRIVHYYFDHNSNWNLLIRWGISFCNQTGVFDQGPHSPILSLMAQELGISEKDSDFQNPFKIDRTEFIPSTDPFQKALREEEKRRKKEEKRKEIRKGPRISRSQSEL
uniref:Coiled-coil domain containing 134 n=1 Tax=Piliocolobus tephrosceles TaxID=591936 RepID=A0A8C9HV63_9PRIM